MVRLSACRRRRLHISLCIVGRLSVSLCLFSSAHRSLRFLQVICRCFRLVILYTKHNTFLNVTTVVVSFCSVASYRSSGFNRSTLDDCKPAHTRAQQESLVSHKLWQDLWVSLSVCVSKLLWGVLSCPTHRLFVSLTSITVVQFFSCRSINGDSKLGHPSKCFQQRIYKVQLLVPPRMASQVY